MTTLTEFLLARIAEDEAMARDAVQGDCAPGSGGLYWMIGSGGEVCVTPARVLAECESKARLVEFVTHRLFDRTYTPEILSILALPYADHPAFQEEWRP